MFKTLMSWTSALMRVTLRSSPKVATKLFQPRLDTTKRHILKISSSCAFCCVQRTDNLFNSLDSFGGNLK